MRRLAALSLMLLLSLPLAGGCAAGEKERTPIDGAMSLERSFKLAVDGVNLAYRQKYLSLDGKRKLAPTVNAGSDALDELRQEIGDGTKPLSASAYQRFVERIAPKLEEVIRAKLEAEAAKPVAKPAPKPAAATAVKAAPAAVVPKPVPARPATRPAGVKK